MLSYTCQRQGKHPRAGASQAITSSFKVKAGVMITPAFTIYQT
jgi:hypothetical protein